MYFIYGLKKEQDMGTYTKDILKLVVLLSLLQLSAEGKPLTSGCSQISQIELYYPTDSGAENTCVQCPECPEGLGLTPQCGSKVPNDTKIECVQCQANVSYSNSHGIESCKACHVCGLRNVIRHCSPDKNRICGTKCPRGYFLDDNHICQECYFCCGNVSEAQRRQGCKDIGMSRDWQCEKTEQNQRCNEDLKKVTPSPTSTKSTADTAPHDHNTITKKQSQLQVRDNANSIAHLPTKSLTGSESTQHGSTPNITSHGGIKVAMSPPHDDSRSAISETQRDNGQDEKHGAASLGPVMGGAVSLIVISVFVLVVSRKGIRVYFSRTKESVTADSPELAPLSTSEPTDSGRTSPHDNLTNEVTFAEEIKEPNLGNIPADIVTTEVPPLSRADNNLTTEEHEKCGKEVCKPNPAHIPADCCVSRMEQLCDDKGILMLFYVKKKLDAFETSTRKTWRSIGQVFQVTSDDLNMIETEYMSGRSPTESLLELLKTREKEPTMREFVDALIVCGRHDVAAVICNWPWVKYFVPVCNDK